MLGHKQTKRTSKPKLLLPFFVNTKMLKQKKKGEKCRIPPDATKYLIKEKKNRIQKYHNQSCLPIAPRFFIPDYTKCI